MRMRGYFRALVLAGLFAAGTATAADDDKAVARAYLEQASGTAAAAHARDLADDPHSPVIGNPQGDVAIVEFFDYQCPYCKAADPRLEKLVKDDGKVKLVLKEFPILTPESRIAARAALAARNQGRYEAYHQALLGFRGKLTEQNIFDMAKDVGLDVPRLRKDMDAPEIADEIMVNMNLARQLKVSFTPGFFVDTKMLSGVSAETMTSKIVFDDEIAQARARKAAK